MWSLLRPLAEGAADLVWPRDCALCGSRLPASLADRWLCDLCHSAVVADLAPNCLRCGSTVGPHTDTASGCSRCRGRTFHFDTVVRLGPYDGRLRQAVLSLKHLPGEPLAEHLGRLWAAERVSRLVADPPTLVVPVPLHWWRRVRRGYNQSAALARGVAHGLGVPFAEPLRRVRSTPHQTARSATERRDNVRDAFRVRAGAAVRGERVLLVDDVLTTGATADAASAALRAGGAAQVTVGVLALR